MIAQSSSSLVPSAGVVEEEELEESFIMSKTFFVSPSPLSRENSNSVKKQGCHGKFHQQYMDPTTTWPVVVASELLELRDY